MDLAKQAQIVDSIHDTLHDFVGQRLKVRANMGRVHSGPFCVMQGWKTGLQQSGRCGLVLP